MIIPPPTANIMDDYHRDRPHLLSFPWTLPHPNEGQTGTFLAPEVAGNTLNVLCHLGGWVMGKIKRLAQKLITICAECKNANSNIV
jgi:hypothetical protein